MGDPVRVVIADANVLINLVHANLLWLLERVPGFEFRISDEVDAEIRHPDQRRQVDEMLQRAIVTRISLEVGELGIFADLRTIMGLGEASCIAIAEARGCYLASDEKRAFRREAIARVGERRLLTTPSVIVLAIRAGLLSVEGADDAKAVLEKRRFKMTFRSFADVLVPKKQP